MAGSPQASVDSSLLQGIRHHLDGLKRTPDGVALYALIERGLRRFGGESGRLEVAFLTFLHSLLGRYAKDPQYDAGTRVKARLIQQRLLLHLPVSATTAAHAREPVRSIKVPAARAEAKNIEAPVAPPAPARRPAPVAPAARAPARDVETAFAAQVTASIARGGAFDGLAEAEQALQNLDTKFGDFGALKEILVKGLDELIRERQAVIHKLNGAGEYLKALETDRRRLNRELTKVRKHALSDELTGLPKREVFVRSLEAEIGRVKRYGFAFALALIDVDGLGAINAQYGREVGDAVLRCYAAEILARFRTYDLVARYGGDEFAVLFPNTQKEGAMRALEKAQKTVATTYINHDGRNFPLPSFSSVLTVYAQGEKAAVLLERADGALDHAKTRGRSQVVIALPSA